ncbi:MAG: serine protease [Bdellovibrionales bacterium]|nr:serine protease [Bdellovibrionales bacterium]
MPWILFFIFSFTVSLSPAEELPTLLENTASVEKIEADVLYEKYKNLVTRILVRGQKSTDRKSQGTAFVVNGNDGILMTSYRLVADKVTNASKYNVSISYLNSEIPVDIIYVDIVTDLALLKTSQGVQFPSQLKISNLALSASGEIIYSMGFPIDQKLNIMIGSFVGTVHIGYSKVSQATLALAPGMEGGPCFNDKGEVVGVNRTLEKDSTTNTTLSTLTNLSHIHSMLNNGLKKGSDKFYISKVPLIEQILYNINSYEKFYQRNPTQTHPEFKIEHLNFSFPVSGIHCEKSVRGKEKATYLACKNDSVSYLGKNLRAFSFSTEAYLNIVSSIAKNENAYSFEKKSAEIERELRGFVDRRPSSQSPNASTLGSKMYCNFHHIRNKNDTHIIARLCSRPIPNFPGLYVTFVKTDVMDSKQRRISFNTTIQSMSMEKTASILNYFWNSIYEDKKN